MSAFIPYRFKIRAEEIALEWCALGFRSTCAQYHYVLGFHRLTVARVNALKANDSGYRETGPLNAWALSSAATTTAWLADRLPTRSCPLPSPRSPSAIFLGSSAPRA